mgnify:FL=1
MSTLKTVYVVMDRKKGLFYGVAGSYKEAQTIVSQWGGETKCTIMNQYVSFDVFPA